MQAVAERLFDGDRLLVRGLPRSGKTLLARAVADALGETAFYFDGAAVTEENQIEEHARLQAEVDGRVNAHGCAQLVFDAFGRAVRRSRGGILHSQLYGQLIDGKRSRDIGAIFTSRYADALDIKVSGSPLLGRVTVLDLPRLTRDDADALGLDPEVARSHFGDATAFAHLALNAEPVGSRDRIIEVVTINAASFARDLPPGAAQVLLGARAFSDVDGHSRRALRGLGRESDSGYQVADVVAESRLLDELRERNCPWPADASASAARFAELLTETGNALWIDRYIYEKPPQLAGFLSAVRQLTDQRLRVLGKPTTDYTAERAKIAAAIGSHTAVEFRVMALQDVKHLHDRHLVDPGAAVGFVLPMADVILGEVEAGAAVAVAMPSIDFDYEVCWSRATPLV